eukprot:TRINITY_DN390_c0_g1_i3.p2 TRINITY_DN390_c0_g1~~TRINITY_DN390_c0_g1_i3.p2  ORF type:complete len:135 (+),score=43.67 TRINITY_DN390_c0_g1_i3:62-406(+)
MSSALVWQITKKSNAFLRKQRIGRGREQYLFSAEPLNLTAQSSFRWSGFANPTPVNLQLEDGKLMAESQDGMKRKLGPMKSVKAAAKGRKDVSRALRQRQSRLCKIASKSKKSA